MKRVIVIFAVMVGCALEGRAAKGGPLLTLGAVSGMSYAEASLHRPVAAIATVTYFRSYEDLLFVQDGDTAIYVHAPTDVKLRPGDRVLIRGTTHESFRTYIQSSDIRIVGHSALPKPVAASFGQMIRGEVDCRRVRVRALIESAEVVPSSAFWVPDTALRMLVDGEPADAEVDGKDAEAIRGLPDAEVEITGVVSGQFDNKMQQTGVLFHIQSLNDVRVLRPSKIDPWSLPVTAMDRVITRYGMRDLSRRVHVRGTITYDQPGTGLVLENGTRTLWINTDSFQPMRVGDLAEATGFPDVRNGFLSLNRSQVRDSGMPAAVVPTVFTWGDLAHGGNDSRGHAYDLVSIEGRVVADVRQSTRDEYLLASGGHLVSAVFRHPGTLSRIPIPPMKAIPIGSRVRVTGICMLESADPFMGDVPFSILMRSFDDIDVVARAPWLNVKHLSILVGLLVCGIFAVGGRAWRTERRMRRQTASLAAIEQRRGHILEEMNACRPLQEILDSIVELVSFQLKGAQCWCELDGGTKAGNCPDPAAAAGQTVRYPITAGFAQPLGTIFVAGRQPDAAREEALSMASGLVALAVETSRLHSDLVHRSEFDLLTDIQNRFSLESGLDRMICLAQQSGGVFGLIYIDLNEFKNVNDLHGHRSGDVYLQQVTARMREQLRPGDTLARLGGDEFAVLVPQVRNRADVEEIAQRMERCFDEPFRLAGNVIRGSASIGVALYPEDGRTRDDLLNAADAAMYAAKGSWRVGTQELANSR